VAIGIPAGRESPLIFDASTSVVARGKIIVAAKPGRPFPRVGGGSGRPLHHRRESRAGRSHASVRRPEGIGAIVHHRHCVRCPDGRRLRLPPEHVGGPLEYRTLDMCWPRCERISS
jgi:hypothetical protein